MLSHWAKLRPSFFTPTRAFLSWVRVLNYDLDIPAEIRAQLEAKSKSIELGNRQALQALEEAFAKGKRGAMPPSQLAIFQPIEKPLSKVRHDYLSGPLHFPHVMPFLGAVDFLETTARTLDKCVDHLRADSNSKPTRATTLSDR